MAYNLKLSIYNFSLYRIINTLQRQQKGRLVTQYKHEAEPTLFSEVAKSINVNVNRDRYLTTVFGALLNYFNDRFMLSTDGTRAVSITQSPAPRPFGTSYKIDGLFKGGETGIVKNVYDQGNASNSTKSISSTDVPAVHYYYKLWIPYDGEDGILMIQSYTNMGCTVTFREQMESFFISLGYKPLWNTMVPTGVMEDYLNRSFINGIKITYNIENRNNAQGGIFIPDGSQKETWLSNLSISFRELLRLENGKQQLESHLTTVISDYDPERDTAKVYYTNEKGQKAHASIRELEDILPNIILPEELKSEGTDEPELNAISEYTDGILDNIKQQIGYATDELV